MLARLDIGAIPWPQRLRHGRSTTIAIVCPERPSGATADLVLSLAESATTRKMAPSLFIGPAPDASAAAFDGLIVIGSATGNWKAEGMSTVEIGGEGACQLHIDEYGGARAVVGHLLTLGHRRIVHFAGLPDGVQRPGAAARGFARVRA